MLDQSVNIKAQVREVNQLSQALEDARKDLKQSVTELRQAKAWTDNLLEAVNEGIVTLDRNGHITFFSPGAERITGIGQEISVTGKWIPVKKGGFSENLPSQKRC